MNIKNLKINTKKIAVITSGFVITQALLYNGWCTIGKKPFTRNQYEAHKFKMEEISQNGTFSEDLYLFKLNNMNPSFLIRTPYFVDYNNVIKRQVYKIPTDKYSTVEINYIIDNISNQELLIKQDYIQEMIKNISNGDGENYNIIDEEFASNIPQNNNYEISYANFTEFKNDIKLEENHTKDAINSINYVLSFTALSISYAVTCSSLTKKYNDKIKKLSK